MDTTTIPTSADAWVGKTNRIAAALFNKVPRIISNPHIDRLDRCWLFVGAPGNGKTSLAVALAHQLAGHPLAIEMINGQSCTIEVVRAWRMEQSGRPLWGNLSVKLIDEVDAASLAACNEIRTYLDRLPPYTAVIATTNKPIKELQEQLQSRFQVWQFAPIPDPLVADYLVRSYRIAADVAHQIAAGVNGNVRAAILDTKCHLDARSAA